MTDSSEIRLRLVPAAVEWREVNGEIVALDVRAAEYIAVTGSGAGLWPSLAAGATHAELIALLVDRYDVDEATAAADVTAFLEALAARGLVTSR